eukprot:TRINITY_DN5738_c0_g1_i2.p1 TRINITY_DN5738_c0_g1~~TRINITY_DN5738_c0_g1_i2.p1  ORF type:complete len:728 (-),score=134.21 TRINITY_DN5738_c0_g1_i2:458-2641(-)
MSSSSSSYISSLSASYTASDSIGEEKKLVPLDEPDPIVEKPKKMKGGLIRQKSVKQSKMRRVQHQDEMVMPDLTGHRMFMVYAAYHPSGYGKMLSKKDALDAFGVFSKAEFILRTVIRDVLAQHGGDNADIVVNPDCLIYVSDDLQVAMRVAIYYMDAIKIWNETNKANFFIPIGSVIVDYGEKIKFDPQSNYCTSKMIQWCKEIDLENASQDVCFTSRFSEEEVNYLKSIFIIREYRTFKKVKESFLDLDYDFGKNEDNIFHQRLVTKSKSEKNQIDKDLQDEYLQKKAVMYISYSVDMDYPNPVPNILYRVTDKRNGTYYRGYCIFSSVKIALDALSEIESEIENENVRLFDIGQEQIVIQTIGLDYSALYIYDEDQIFGNPLDSTYIMATRKPQQGRVVITAEALQKIKKQPSVSELFYPQVPNICYLVTEDESQSINDSDIIELDSYDKDLVDSESSSGGISLLDLIPRNAQVNIFRYFGEEDIGKLSRVSKSWRDVSTDTKIWRGRLHTWNINTYTLMDEETMQYPDFIEKYREHKENQQRRREEERYAARQRREQERIEAVDKYFARFFFNPFTLDLPSILLVILFSVFVALKLDGIFNFSWHVVYIPIYVFFGWGTLGLSIFDYFAMVYGMEELTKYNRKIRKTKSLSSIFIGENSKGHGRYLTYMTVGCLLSSAVLCAEYSENRSFPTFYLILPYCFISYMIDNVKVFFMHSIFTVYLS